MSQRWYDAKRGGAPKRRADKRWLLSPESGFGGDGTTVPCVHCGAPLSYESMERDRIVCGGSYQRSNLQPAGGPLACNCNRRRHNRQDWHFTPIGAIGGE